VQKIGPFYLVFQSGRGGGRRLLRRHLPNSRVGQVTTLPSKSPRSPPGSVKIVDFTLFRRLSSLHACVLLEAASRAPTLLQADSSPQGRRA
jgi:hypothetical protein